jgi:hypothetical protein
MSWWSGSSSNKYNKNNKSKHGHSRRRVSRMRRGGRERETWPAPEKGHSGSGPVAMLALVATLALWNSPI